MSREVVVQVLEYNVVVQVLEYKAKNKRTKETLLTCLADLFYSIVTQKRKVCSRWFYVLLENADFEL